MINELMMSYYDEFGLGISISVEFSIYDNGKKRVKYWLHYTKPFDRNNYCESFDSIESITAFVESLITNKESAGEFDKASDAVK